MAMKKTEIIKIQAKPKMPYYEYKLVSHPEMQDAIAIFEDVKGYRPARVYHYDPPSHKFQSWIIKEE